MEALLVEDQAQEAPVWACPRYFAALERVHCNCLFKDNNKGMLSKEFSTQSAALSKRHDHTTVWRRSGELGAEEDRPDGLLSLCTAHLL